MSTYPQPREDAINAPLLAAWREGRLALQRCKECGKAIFYPRPMCPHCWSEALEWFDASGRGTIVSYSLVFKPHNEAFDNELPVILVEVELEEKALMLSRIVDAKPDQVRSGLKVKIVPMPDAKRYPLPTFRLA
jgi:hypothetical protein